MKYFPIKTISLSIQFAAVAMMAVMTVVVGVTSNHINLAQCHDPISSSTGSWIVPSSLMSDFFVDTNFSLEHKLLTCENFHEFDIEIPQIPVDDDDVSGSTESTIEIEYQSGKDQQQPTKNNVTYFVTEDVEINVSHSDNYKPVATFTPTGYLILNNEYFPPSEFCLKRISSTRITVQVCVPNCESVSSPCFPLCCALGKVLYHNGTAEKCFQVEGGISAYQPALYRDVYYKLTPEEGAKISPHFYKHMPQCEPGRLGSYPFRRIHNVNGAIVRVLSDGRVKVFLPLERKWKEYQDFCLAGLVTPPEEGNNNESLSVENLFHFSGNEEDQILYVCGDYSANEVVAPHFYVPVYFINSFFLLITVLVYILLWEKQNVHGWTVLSFVLAMFFMYIFLAWSHLTGLLHEPESPEKVFHFTPPFLCHFVGILAHFFFLATFCWLSVINMDLWWTFKSMTPVSGRSKGLKRFICYSIFAWGTPAVIIGVGLILSNVFEDPLSEVKIPGYGRVTCFLEPSAKGLYLYYDIGILMGINLIFMGLTLFTIYTFKRGTRGVLQNAVSNSSQTLSAKLFFKLFVVMGVTWIFEVISWSQSVEETIFYWIILDLFNIVQSTGVFFIFVCKRKILNQLEQKYPSLKIITGPLKKIAVSGRATRTVTTTSDRPERTQSTGLSLRQLKASSVKAKASTEIGTHQDDE